MNSVQLVGNICNDIRVNVMQSGTKVVNFCIATRRGYKNAKGEFESDFINCVAWDKRAEFIERYFSKGKKIGITGCIQTRDYTAQDGTKRYVTEVVVEHIEFVGENKNGANGARELPPQPTAYDPREVKDAYGVPDNSNDELPF